MDPLANLREQRKAEARLKAYRETFKVFDKEEKNIVKKDHIGRVMQFLGQPTRPKELDAIDQDGDGNVTFEEYVEFMKTPDPSSTLSASEQELKELRDAFRVFDKHNRGYITISDLRAVLQCLGEDIDDDESETYKKDRRWFRKLIVNFSFQLRT